MEINVTNHRLLRTPLFEMNRSKSVTKVIRCTGALISRWTAIGDIGRTLAAAHVGLADDQRVERDKVEFHGSAPCERRSRRSFHDWRDRIGCGGNAPRVSPPCLDRRNGGRGPGLRPADRPLLGLVAEASGWQVAIVPPQLPLPFVTFADDTDALDPEARDAGADIGMGGQALEPSVAGGARPPRNPG